jgi:hypothetical protein
MAIDQAVADVLDETIHALTFMDFNGLQALEADLRVCKFWCEVQWR